MSSDFRETQFYRYHQATKHTRLRLHSEPWYLDWENQPNPFRIYAGAKVVRLPVPKRPPARDFFAPETWSAAPLRAPSVQDLSQFLYHSVAISAWKEVPGTGARWALRVNPSSGNLHPTETHLILRGVEGIEDGIYHFRVDTFELEGRWVGPVDSVIRRLAEGADFGCGAVTFVLTSIFWREAWKYRDRAFRYCHHDLGHALACLCEMLRGLGHAPRSAHLFDDALVSRLLGLESTDERPALLVSFGPEVDAGENPGEAPISFVGEGNALSPEVIDYRSIEEVYRASSSGPQTCAGERPRAAALPTEKAEAAIALDSRGSAIADLWHVIRTRRSGISFDGRTGMTARDLGLVLFRATAGMPSDICTFRRGDAAGESSGFFHIHLYLYVHRVEGVTPGLHLYSRERHALIPLKEGDQRGVAAALSLDQSIAADSAFSVSMVADLRGAWERWGERGYRAVHIEAGHIGQMLYLGAESVGLNATGIGAFFDDEVNRYLDLPEGFEVIYHFTVGRAAPDVRVRQLKSYWFEGGTT